MIRSETDRPVVAEIVKTARSKRGCVFPMVILPAFRMEQYRVNDHPYQAPQFTVLIRWSNFSDDLIFQKSILMTQCQRFDFARLVMRELIVIKREIK